MVDFYYVPQSPIYCIIYLFAHSAKSRWKSYIDNFEKLKKFLIASALVCL